MVLRRKKNSLTKILILCSIMLWEKSLWRSQKRLCPESQNDVGIGDKKDVGNIGSTLIHTFPFPLKDSRHHLVEAVKVEGEKFMKLSETVKPVSYLQEYALEIIHQFSEGQQTLVITEDGEAKAVLLDIHVYEQMQESLALLKILATSSQHLRQGKTKPVKHVFQKFREKIQSE